MTLHEQKLDILKRGYVLSERMFPENKELVQVVVFIQDTDGLKIESTPAIEQITYLNEDNYITLIKTMVQQVDGYIASRHAQNPNTCNHNSVDVGGGLIGCLNCMAKLGTTSKGAGGVRIDLSHN
jgi:hypothetical protein